MKKIIGTLIAACLSAILVSMFLTSCGSKHVHEFGEWITVKQATCTAEGARERYCICLEREMEIIPISAHKPEAFTSCKIGQRCSVCRALLISSTSHKFGDFVVTEPATCTESGTEQRTCSVCGATEEKAIFAKGHKYGSNIVVKEATCTSPGIYERYCACGDKVSHTVTVDHTGEWNVLIAPTKREDGMRERNCSVCHQTITEVLYATGSLGLRYKTNDANMTCTLLDMGTCIDTDVVIPRIYNGYTVTEIAEKAFWNCKIMRSLTIPDTVTKIGSDFISDADYLNTLFYNGSVTFFSDTFNGAPIKTVIFGGTVAFKVSEHVQEVILTDSVTRIASDAFSGLRYLKNIAIPEGVTSIGSYAFADCPNLVSVLLPDTLTSIGSYAFSQCPLLESIRIPARVTEIGSNVFAHCTALKSVELAEGITKIPSMGFYFCESLERVVIPSSVTKIGYWAFYGCRSLTEITAPGELTHLGSGAFSHCDALTTVTLSGHLTELGDNVFSYCPALTSVTLPGGLPPLSSNLFVECRNLKSITFRGTVDEWKAIPKQYAWREKSVIQTVICTDGVVTL